MKTAQIRIQNYTTSWMNAPKTIFKSVGIFFQIDLPINSKMLECSYKAKWKKCHFGSGPKCNSLVYLHVPPSQILKTRKSKRKKSNHTKRRKVKNLM